MAGLQAGGPNAEQIKYWNETSGPKWVALHERIDAQIRALGQRAIERAVVMPGERVVDVGCGCGLTTIDIARRVGATGAVLGVDICTPMLETAERHARENGLTQVRFENADAQTFQFPPAGVDLAFSRFGVMFFSDPEAAFTNLRAALRPGGRLAFICWQAVQQNPWMLEPLMAVAQYITLPQPPAPDAPGPFSLADAERVRGILTHAGFTGIDVEAVQETIPVGGGGDLEETVDFLLQMGPVGAALRDTGAELRPRLADAVRQALAAYHTPEGVRMPAAAWLVSARNPSA